MHARQAPGTPAARPPRGTGLVALAAVTVLLAAGCGATAKPAASGRSAAGGHSSAAAARCGTARTAANVPVDVEVERGQVSCATAMTVEQGYAKAIREGRAPGNGGGGPVRVQGWTCEGFPTPEVLRTGQASKCVSGAGEILAVLPVPA